MSELDKALTLLQEWEKKGLGDYTVNGEYIEKLKELLKPKPLYVLVNVVDYVTESARVFTDKVKAVEAAEEGSEPYWGKDNVEHDATDRIYWNQIRDGDASNHTAVFEVTPEA